MQKQLSMEETDRKNTRSHEHHELSPLLLSQTSMDDDSPSSLSLHHQRSKNEKNEEMASVTQTILNLMKTCLGTGTLALSYSCRQGGWLLFVVGTAVLASWNVYCVQRLCFSLNYIPTVEDEEEEKAEEENSNQNNDKRSTATTNNTAEMLLPAASSSPSPRQQMETHHQLLLGHLGPPPPGTSTLGRVSWYAYGRQGLIIMDSMMLCLLIGVLVSFVAACISFLNDTPFSLGTFMNAVVVASIMASISLVPHLGYLANTSAIGLVFLFATIIVIAGYGVTDMRRENEEAVELSSLNIANAPSLIPIWPESLYGASQWFGVAVFGYGVVPLTFNYRDSMSEPYKMVGATTIALMSVSCLYVVIGIGLLLLFPDLTGDVLHELPTTGLLPVCTRLLMVLVILMTAPLLLVPCGELLEGRWQLTTKMQRILVRVAIMVVCVTVACLVPGFVKVVSLVGSACVGTVSLILPPLLHLKLSTASSRTATEPASITGDDNSHSSKAISQWTDKIMLAVGIAATVISTILSL